MVMKRYPDGTEGEFFFQKHAPKERPPWIGICEIRHPSANVVDFPVIENLAGLIVGGQSRLHRSESLVCAMRRCRSPGLSSFRSRPHAGRGFPAGADKRRPLVRDALAELKISSYPKTTGSRGLHIYVPIVRGPVQKQVWTFAKSVAKKLEADHGGVITAEYRVAKRPDRHVLADYNQNAWAARWLQSNSVRPKPHATVSAPVTWQEVEGGIEIEDLAIRN